MSWLASCSFKQAGLQKEMSIAVCILRSRWAQASWPETDQEMQYFKSRNIFKYKLRYHKTWMGERENDTLLFHLCFSSSYVSLQMETADPSYVHCYLFLPLQVCGKRPDSCMLFLTREVTFYRLFL